MSATLEAAPRRPRIGFWTAVFFALLGLFLVVAVLRFTRGLGATTHLSDRVPWGLWIGFDILCGVGLAAGAFTSWRSCTCSTSVASSRSCAPRC